MENLKLRNKEQTETPAPIRYGYSDLEKEYIETECIYNNELVCTFTTDFTAQEYNRIFREYKDKEFPILVDNHGRAIMGEEDVLRDFQDEETLTYNRLMAKKRVVSLLKLTSRGIDFPDSMEECLEIYEDLGQDLLQVLVNQMTTVINIKFSSLKDRKNIIARNLLAYTDMEKKYYTEQKIMRKRAGEKIIDVVDDRKPENGVTEHYITLELAKQYPFIDKDLVIRILKGDLTNDEETLLHILKAKYALEAEREERIQKEIEKKQSRG